MYWFITVDRQGRLVDVIKTDHRDDELAIRAAKLARRSFPELALEIWKDGRKIRRFSRSPIQAFDRQRPISNEATTGPTR